MKKTVFSILSLFLAATMLLAGCAKEPNQPEAPTESAGTEAGGTGSQATAAPETGDTAPEPNAGTDADTNADTNADTPAADGGYGADIPEPEAPTLPADAIDVTAAWGVKRGKGHALANSIALAAGVANMPDGSTVYFPEGEYEVAFAMFVSGKKNIRIVGHKATLVRTGINNTEPIQPVNTDPAIPAELQWLTSYMAFIYSGANSGFTVEGLTFVYDMPTSLSGKVLSVSGGTAEIELTDGSTVTGGEYATVINTFTPDGIPDRTLEQYAQKNFPIEKTGDKTIRVTGLDPGGASNLKKGTRVCLRLCTGRDYVIIVQETADAVFKDLTVCNAFNGGIHMSNRCINATLENITVKSDNPEALMSLNADILHIAGLGGTLTVNNCHFERPGDDCINVHSGAYLVDAVSGNTATLFDPRFDFSPLWAKVGDTLTFYDAESFATLGSAKITAVDGQSFTFDALPAGVKKGSVVANTFTSPAVTIRNTTVKYNRARGFLLQTSHATVENCDFYGTALAAILIAPDLQNWYEMAPVTDLSIRHNRFDSCGYSAPAVIQITASHDDPSKTYSAYIHKDISITNNDFVALRTPAVRALCTSGLTVTGNTTATYNYKKHLIYIKRCENVILDGAMADKADTEDVLGLTVAD